MKRSRDAFAAAAFAAILAASGAAMAQPQYGYPRPFFHPQAPGPVMRPAARPAGGPAGGPVAPEFRRVYAAPTNNRPMYPPPPAPPPARAPNSLGADWRLQQNEVRQAVRERQLMPLSSVIEQLARRSPGRQLDAGFEYRGDRPTYRVRWMTRDGRRVDYLIDATTGAIVGGN